MANAKKEYTYGTRHRALGRAKEHPCELQLDGCEGQAKDWALDWSRADPKNLRVSDLTTSRGMYFSTDDEDYIPACRACHRQFDEAVRKARGSA